MLRRFVWILVALPVAILLITLAVANRHGVRLVLDPFRPDEPVLFLVLPFYAYLFGTLLVGILIGGARHLDDAGALAAHRPPAGGRGPALAGRGRSPLPRAPGPPREHRPPAGSGPALEPPERAPCSSSMAPRSIGRSPIQPWSTCSRPPSARARSRRCAITTPLRSTAGPRPPCC